MAWIARDKAYLAKATLKKIKHKSQWIREKKEFDEGMSDCMKNKEPERNIVFSD